tara:strand:- start:5287 stop:5520 length:234 start_codon:yes stop_codon:yes gene_type:complete
MELCWKSLPIDLYKQIMLYQPIESPAMKAWNLATIRLVTTNELEISGTIKLNDEANPEDYILNAVDAEYYLFLLENT